jgi:chromosome segregation ATPase
MELQEVQLTEAKTIAEEADRKYEEVVRKCRMVEQELERVVDKAEEFEGKSHEFETRLDADRQKLKELEELAGKNGEQEDIFEEQVRKLAANLSNEESRAEFAERTVDKLESTIDYLQDSLYNEKLAFIEMSKKLDQTLNDMMQV